MIPHPGTERRAGGALIVLITLLAVLAILAATFGRLMSLERGSARNYQYAVQARLAAEAGVEYAAASIVADLRSGKLEDRQAAWRYFGEDADCDDVSDAGEDKNLNGILERASCPLAEAVAPSYAVAGKDYSGELPLPHLPSGWKVRYKLKIVDCNSMINLNNDYPNFASLLNTFGIMLKDYLALDRNIVETIQYGKKANGDPIIGGEAILKYRDTLPNKRFTSREDLLPILPRGKTDLGYMEPFLTVHGWRDENAFLDGKRQVDGYNVAWWEYWWGPAYLRKVPRYPININTADKVVLDSVHGTGVGSYAGETNQRDFFWPQPQWTSNGARARVRQSDYRIFSHGWWWSPWGGGAKWWSQMMIDRRRGNEIDANGDEHMQSAEDTIQNGWPDLGPFRSAQDFANYTQRPDHCGWEFMYNVFTPHAPPVRYNPDFTAASFHHGGNNGLSFQWGSRHLSDKTNAWVAVPEWSFRPYGWFEITSLGTVQDAEGNIVASRTIRTVSQLFHALEQQTQQDFLSKPIENTTWKSGGTYPTEPWSATDATKRLVRATTWPENCFDPGTGKTGSFDASKAETCAGGVMATSVDWTLANEIFFASYKTDARAERGLGGQVATKGSNQGSAHIEDASMGNATFATGSDLFPDGIHHHRYRARSTSYANEGFKSMRPDKGMHEFWWKCDSQYYPGEIFTAFFPADPSVEGTESTEGIQHRVFLAYVPMATSAFQGLLQLPVATNSAELYYRWWNWGVLWNDPGVIAVPVLVAERVFYAAMLDPATGMFHGRDTGYLDLTTTASYANGAYAFTAVNWVDYEYVPLLNWGRDQMWHHVRVNWQDGTDLELYVDDVRAPYRKTWPRSTWLQGGVVLPFWCYKQMTPQIIVGGVNMQEYRNGVGWKGWDPGFKWGPGGKYWAYPNPLIYMGTNGTDGTNHRHCGTIDNVRIFADPRSSPYPHRYQVTQQSDGTWNYGAYKNEIRMPLDATRLARVVWSQWQPTYDPKIRDDRYLTGRYIKPAERPVVVLEVETKAGTIKMDEKTMKAAPYSKSDDEAARIARGDGYSVDLALEPGEVFEYIAHLQYKKLGGGSSFPYSLHVAPILDSVTFFYTTRAPVFVTWEEF